MPFTQLFLQSPVLTFAVSVCKRSMVNGLVDQIRTEGKIAPFPPGVNAPFRSRACQGGLIY